jgi:dTDP-4-dehydrorhamnose reductase
MIIKKYPERSHIVRLGWQIGNEPEKNNMLAYLVQGKNIEASTNWILSTSFMEDTAEALVKLLDSTDFGICHLDSNQDDLSFYEIVIALKEKYNLPINIIQKSEPIRNNRLVAKRDSIASIGDRLYLHK